MILLTFLSLLTVACSASVDTGPPSTDRGFTPLTVRGFGAASDAFRVYLIAEGELLILDLDPPHDAVGMVSLDLAVGLPSVRGVELVSGAGREALLPSGPAIPVPDTVVRTPAEAGTLFIERIEGTGVRVATRALLFSGDRSIDLAPRTVPLGTYPPGVAVPPGK